MFRDPGQILKIRDCPGDSGTVGAYGVYVCVSVYAGCVMTVAFVYCVCSQASATGLWDQETTNQLCSGG